MRNEIRAGSDDPNRLRSQSNVEVNVVPAALTPGRVGRVITITVSPTVYSLLEVLTQGETGVASVDEVVLRLIDHAQQGVYRPGAWEREWLCQAFGSDWIQYLEPGDPYGRPNSPMFQRPPRWRNDKRR